MRVLQASSTVPRTMDPESGESVALRVVAAAIIADEFVGPHTFLIWTAASLEPASPAVESPNGRMVNGISSLVREDFVPSRL